MRETQTELRIRQYVQALVRPCVTLEQCATKLLFDHAIDNVTAVKTGDVLHLFMMVRYIRVSVVIAPNPFHEDGTLLPRWSVHVEELRDWKG